MFLVFCVGGDLLVAQELPGEFDRSASLKCPVLRDQEITAYKYIHQQYTIVEAPFIPIKGGTLSFASLFDISQSLQLTPTRFMPWF